jgi:diguanylate cyclase (GGDEF)-like protein
MAATAAPLELVPEARPTRTAEVVPLRRPVDQRSGIVVLVCVDPATALALSARLPESRLPFTLASGWTDAIEAFDRLRPGLVLLDAGFEDGSGFGLAAALRRRSENVPVIVICGSKADVRRALEVGASDVIEKPVDHQLLMRRIAHLRDAFLAEAELEDYRLLLRSTKQAAADAWDRLERQGLIDRLTGLPNREGFAQLVERSLRATRTPDRGLALLFLDLDRFTEINETFGRRLGDQVLRQVGERLSQCLREDELQPRPSPGLLLKAAARLSGDEFMLMLNGFADEKRLTQFSLGVLRALGRGFRVGETQVYLSASLGIATTSEEGATAERLLQQAETAMYEAKRRGGASYCYYSPSLSGATSRKLGMDRMLRSAFQDGTLTLSYQPVLDATSGRVQGVEALLRWTHPTLGPISPSEFVPVAESTGLMTLIGTWVLREACRQLRAWMDAGLAPMRMAVNVSRCQLEQGDLAAIVREVLEETGIEPSLLELELSERGVLRNEPRILAQLQELRSLGVRLLADDFGTGQSAIAYLKQLPLDGLKIDRSFVDGVVEGGDDTAITSAMVAMAHRLKLGVVAEGVETDSQLEVLRGYGCESIQGFLFSKAVPPEQLQSWLMSTEARGGPLPPPGHA